METIKSKISIPYDLVVSFLLTATGLCGIYILLNPSVLDVLIEQNSPYLKDPIASLIRDQGMVRYRQEVSSFWQDIHLRERSLYSGDSIFTGNNGTAKIVFKEGDEITLLPNTLITLEKKEDSVLDETSTQIKIESGNLQVSSKKKSIKVKSKSQIVDLLSGSNLLLNATESGLKIQGQGQIRSKDETILVQKSENINLDLNGVKNITPELKVYEPSDLQIFEIYQDQLAVSFRFDSTHVIKFLELTSEKKNDLIDFKNFKGYVNLNPGDYKWRVHFENGKSNIQSFSVKKIPYPTIEYPKSNKIFTSILGVAKINFKISSLTHNKDLILEIKSVDEIRKIKLEKSEFTVELKDGKYIAQINSHLESEKVTFEVSSASVEAVIKKMEENKKEVLVKSEQKPIIKKVVITPQVFVFKKVETKEIEKKALTHSVTRGNSRYSGSGSLDKISMKVSWEPLKDIINYQVSLVGDQKVIQKSTTTDSYFEFFLKSIGYDGLYYQVNANLKNGSTLSGPKIPIEIHLSSPILKKPAQKTYLDDDGLMTWEKTALTDGYQIEISKNKTFADLVKKETVKQNFFMFKGYKGLFYWRVRAVAGSKKSIWSEIYKFKSK